MMYAFDMDPELRLLTLRKGWEVGRTCLFQRFLGHSFGEPV
jgi:hypothetical protein